MFGRKRAISPLIATIILIAICVGGGLLIYTIFFSTAGTIIAKGQLTVEAVDLVKDTAGGNTFSITIKNSGNKPATDIGVTIGIGSTAYSLPISSVTSDNPLQPGQMVSAHDSITAFTPIIGNTYAVRIDATFADGSTFTHTTSVQCRGG